jgi:hypothetical protein
MENGIQSNEPLVQPLPQVSAPIPTPPSTNWSKILLFTVLGLVIVAVSLFVGVQIGKNQTPGLQPIAPEPTLSSNQTVTNPKTIPTSITSPSMNPATSWKTYKNTRFNFSFKYPPELIYVYDQSDQYVENGISNAMILIQNFDGSKPRTETDSDFQIVAYIANKSGQFNLEDPQGEQTKTTINGVEVIKSFTTQKWVLVPTVFFRSSPNKVAFQLSNPKSTNKVWFDQIVSTFQVTN